MKDNKKEKLEEISKRRKEIENEFSGMLKEMESPFTIDHIKDIIYHEEDQDDLMKIISMFNNGLGDTSDLENILDLTNDAWNYFPHKSLNGLCPMEMILRN